MKDKKSSQIDKYRIDKLNEVNFQWSLQKSTKISWNDRFEVRSLSPLGPRPCHSSTLLTLVLLLFLPNRL